jgi:ATP-binding cassette, sub-family E, member 1
MHQRAQGCLQALCPTLIAACFEYIKECALQGEPSRRATAHEPQSLLSGMNSFLKNLDITFRRDPTNYRPRINKLNSQKDHEQKVAGTYYYIDADE